MSNETTPFGKILKRVRIDQGKTVRQLASEVGLSFGYISQIERGFAKPPSVQYIKKLADALQFPCEELYDAASEKAPANEACIRGIYKHLKSEGSISLSQFVAMANKYRLLDDDLVFLPSD